ncbi:MAG TPA: general stress protein [Candidatus Binatia bacterium]|nr:general stress protein [Candidatus Binatia bacterium]
MANIVVCTVESPATAEAIIEDLKDEGFAGGDISVAMQDQAQAKKIAAEKDTKAAEGAVTGAVTGGLLGGIAGWLVGIGTLAIPGLGPLIAAGPLMAALSGAAVGATTGGIVGALVGLGIPEDEARRYEERVRAGDALISVEVEDAAERERAREVFLRHGGRDIGSAGEGGWSRGATAGV